MHHDHSYFDEHAETWEEDNPVPEKQLLRVLQHCHLSKGQRVLDVGTGTGRLLPHIRNQIGNCGELYAVDPSERMLEQARRRHPEVEFENCPAEKLPYESNFIDRVICYAVYPHFFSPSSAIEQMHRVLQKNGLLIIAHTHGRSTINAVHHRASRHVAEDRLPPPSKVAQLLTEVGMHIIKTIDDDDFYMVSGKNKSAQT